MPGSRGVCFVCGSPGAELPLYSKPRDHGPYFPFLEHHEPPKGCRLPGPEGVVDSCRVCYAFLTQQWDTYERSKTPAIKRLYWLKRSDDLAFTGAEMKLQGEYMAQVMGLQYQPNCHDNCSNPPLSPDDRSVASASYSTSGGIIRDGGNYAGLNTVREVDSVGSVSGSNASRAALHRGGAVDSKLNMCTYGGDADGALDLTVPSKIGSGAGENRNGDHSSPRRSSSSTFKDSVVCFICGSEVHALASKVVSSIQVSVGEPYFPFLEKMAAPRGAVPLNSQMLTRVCETCFSSMYQQWLSYERACTPNSARIYKVNDRYIDGSNARHLSESKPEIKAHIRADEVCYLCGQVRPHAQICLLYTVPSTGRKHQMYFPFIRELRRPQGAQPLNPDGTVLVCVSCHGNLQSQWQQYESDSVHLVHRRYSLLPIITNPTLSRSFDSKNGTTRIDSPGNNSHQRLTERSNEGADITQPLNIHISKSPVLSSSNSAHGLLAIAPQTPRSITNDVSSFGAIPSGTIMSEMVASGSNSKSSDLPRGSVLGTSVASIVGTTVPHPLQQATALPKKVCFLCGETCLVSKAHLLYSYPVRHEAKSTFSTPSMPFFPFLANQEPAAGAEAVTEDGTVIACTYCYHSLVFQWREYEESKNPADSNRWLRKYSIRDFVCYVCEMVVSRRRIRSLEVDKFHFLKDHKAPLNALVLDGGEAVAVCDACSSSLTHQYAEYERMGVPMELHKYNWTKATVSEENSQDNTDAVSNLHMEILGEVGDKHNCNLITIYN